MSTFENNLYNLLSNYIVSQTKLTSPVLPSSCSELTEDKVSEISLCWIIFLSNKEVEKWSKRQGKYFFYNKGRVQPNSLILHKLSPCWALQLVSIGSLAQTRVNRILSGIQTKRLRSWNITSIYGAPFQRPFLHNHEPGLPRITS